MSWQNYYSDTSSAHQMHYNPATTMPGVYAAELELQTLYGNSQTMSPSMIPHPSSIPQNYVFTNSEITTPHVSANEYGYTSSGHTNMTHAQPYPDDGNYPRLPLYMPGMPLQHNDFHQEFDSSAYENPGNSHDVYAPGTSNFYDDGRNKQHSFRGRGKRAGILNDPGRGRPGYNYRDRHEFQKKGTAANNYYGNENYFYEELSYKGPSTARRRGRGRFPEQPSRGRGSRHEQYHRNVNSRLGNGDGNVQQTSKIGIKQPQNNTQKSRVKDFQKQCERTSATDEDCVGTTDLSSHEIGNMMLVGELCDSKNQRHSGLGNNGGEAVQKEKSQACANVRTEQHERGNSSMRGEYRSAKVRDRRATGERDYMHNHESSEGIGNAAGSRRGRGAKRGMVQEKGSQSGSRNTEPVKLETDESQRGSLTEQLASSTYECMVCCEAIRVESAVWSCDNCFHVFHLSCIQKWSRSSMCKETKNWRCPGCQNISSYVPNQYRCFCGRRKDPPYIRGEIPHSCGDCCRLRRKGNCKHPCTILCHPGPCPPCSSMVKLACDCGKVRKSMRCTAATSFKCDRVCGKSLNCKDHSCYEMCHTGSCPPCAVSKQQGCFCEKTKRTVVCGTDEFKVISFSCEKICGSTLSCGNHLCEEQCHPGECPVCPLVPDVLKVCCCGNTSLAEMDVPKRVSCLDPVPQCGKICQKPMACGSATLPHLCDKACHEGECGPCKKETHLRCECGATEKRMPCEVAVTFNDKNPFKCQRRCGKKKMCGKHKCLDNCCVKDIHICEIVCGKPLSCGLHKCEELCHRGNCKRCLQASFEELTCYCGLEILEPPVPCGARPPECHRLCTREHECSHPVRHNCHQDEKCIPCTELIDRMCVGGHMLRKNIPCYMVNVTCGYPCDKMLSCGHHKCQKICHKGECLEEGTMCTQLCQKIRPACGHPCNSPCHPDDCPDTPCKTEMTITCPCGNRTAKAQCQAGGDRTEEIIQFQRLSLQNMAESGGQGVDMSQFSQKKKNNKRLDCDTNCAMMERNKRMALALQIKSPDLSSKLGNPTFTDFLKDYTKKNPKFAASIEKNLNDLVQTAKQSVQSSRSFSFPPMNRDQRRYVHELAELYGCQTQSYDFEPNKNVVATASKDKCWLPNVTPTQFLLKDQTPKAPPPISSFKNQGVTFTVLERKKPAPPSTPARAWDQPGATAASVVAQAAPAIDYFDFDNTSD